jgi:hypothetical protein
MTHQSETELLERTQRELREVDDRIEKGQLRVKEKQTQLDEAIENYERGLRGFALGTHPDPAGIADERQQLEREIQGLMLDLEDLQNKRQELYPRFAALQEAAARDAHQRKMNELFQDFSRAREHEVACAKALDEAKAKTERAHLIWQSEVDRERLKDYLARQYEIAGRLLKPEERRQG